MCPIKNEPIYVGSTINSLRQRLSGHRTMAKDSTLPLYEYIRTTGITPIIVPIEEVGFGDIRMRERFWTDKLLEDGFELFNKKMCYNLIPSGSIKINLGVYEKVNQYCKKNGLLISHFATEAIKEKLEKLNQEKA